MAAVAGGMGGIARVLLAIQSGSRGARLVFDALLGGCLGIMAVGGLVYVDPSMRDAGWPLLVAASAAGCAGAMGTRALDIIEAAIRRRLGV